LTVDLPHGESVRLIIVRAVKKATEKKAAQDRVFPPLPRHRP
jgi:hypothetical protein